MLNIFKKFLDYNEREIKRLKKKVDEINALEDQARKLKDSDFPKETQKLKEQIAGEKDNLDFVLPWAYALVREASRRVHNERHFDVQLMAGIALHEHKIAEQKTGEGKTLTATSPLYLNALLGRGSHLVTVNDYLVRRDAGWMGEVYNFLGLTTSAIISDASFIFDPEYVDDKAGDWRLRHLKPISRKEAYDADVTYGINSEFGFDYLRDNMASTSAQTVQRGFYFAIIDEADSVLIDEARTPHIISAPYDEDTTKYYMYAKIVKVLEANKDYVIDEKLRTANLTEEGIHVIEQQMGVDNIYEKDFDALFHIEAALKAETLFRKDKEYIVQGNEVVIVDEFTGRLLQGRRFSEGLHQAIEAKERVPIQKESKTLATVSLQNYFRMYEKLAGMTGTASTESEEFHKIYKTDVLVLPTHRPNIRQDHPDMIYKTERAKYNAVVEDIAEQYKTGRPVLVGTTSIEKNEYLSNLLKKKGVPHRLLNAKNHEQEANIIAEAGKKGAITIATNMAGRGVDIILGGNPPSETEGYSEAELKKMKLQRDKDHDEVVSLGGLYVIGTERHESRRIDNQLRGRAGRQGDPGETRFFVSLEDDLMRIFGGEQISNMMTMLKFPEDQPLSHGLVSKAIEQSQVKVEGFNFDIRKHLVDFDDVLNKQREIIYSLRRNIRNLPDSDVDTFKETVLQIFRDEIALIVNGYSALNENFDASETEVFVRDLNMIVPHQEKKIMEMFKKRDFEELQLFCEEKVEEEFDAQTKKVGQEIWYDIVRMIFLQTIDQYWTEHLTAIEDLREGINLRGYAQLDPLIEYKNEAYKMFERLVASINGDVTRRLLSVEVNVNPQETVTTTELPPADQKKLDAESKDETKEKKKTQTNSKSKSTKSKPANATANKEPKKMIYKSASSVDPYAAQEQVSTNKATNLNWYPENVTSEMVMPSESDQPLEQTQNPDQIGGFKITPPGVQKHTLGRNDPCWCGSGKKWKKCHYPELG